MEELPFTYTDYKTTQINDEKKNITQSKNVDTHIHINIYH